MVIPKIHCECSVNSSHSYTEGKRYHLSKHKERVYFWKLNITYVIILDTGFE